MKKIAILLAAAALLLSGCATTIRSNVTAFNNWPADLPDKSFVFEAPQGPEDTLEYRSYQVLVSNELAKLGFHQADDGHAAKLMVGMHFRTIDQPVQLIQAYDPFWGPWGRGNFGYYRGPFMRPYFPAPLEVDDTLRHFYLRQLNVTINGSNGSKLYDVTVSNSSTVQATPLVMPALVQSAFAGFPGKSGVPYQVDLKIDPKTDAQDAAPAAPPAKVASDKG